MATEDAWGLLQEPHLAVSQWSNLPWGQQVGIAGIIIFTILEARVVYHQAATIKERRSATALSIPCFSYLFFHNTVAITYGWYQDLDSLVLNGLVLMHPYATLLWNTFRIKEWFVADRLWMLGGAGMMASLLVFPRHNALLFFIFSLGSLFALTLQLSELLKRRLVSTKSKGVLRRRVFVCFVLQNGAWFMYAQAVRDWPLMTLSVLGGSISLCIVLLLVMERYKETD